MLPHIRRFTDAAVRRIDILSQALSPNLYCDEEWLSLLSSLLRRSAVTQMRVLVRDPRPLYGVRHELLSLIQRLPSHAKIRVCLPDSRSALDNFFCADTEHLIDFQDESRPAGFARWGARVESRQRLNEFEHLWLYGSKNDTNLRTLIL